MSGVHSLGTSCLIGLCFWALSLGTQAAVITVNSLADDVFPDSTGAIFDASGNPIVLASPKCTLRMAIMSSNLDQAVGGANGCNPDAPTSFLAGGADQINFAPALANGTILLNINQPMPILPEGSAVNTTSLLWVWGALLIDGSVGGGRITLDGGGSISSPLSRRILRIQELPVLTTERAGATIAVQIRYVNFQNSRVEGAGGCISAFETISLSDVNFSNCISSNKLGGAAGGGLFVRSIDATSTTYRPDVSLTRVAFKNNRAIQDGGSSAPGGGGFFLGTGTSRVGHVVLTQVEVGGLAAGEGNLAEGGYGGGSIVRADSVTITNSRFDGNIAQTQEAGGLRIQETASSSVVISETFFRGNQAQVNHGGLVIRNNGQSSILLNQVSILNNRAAQFGGVAINQGTGTLALRGVLIQDNVATQRVGGLHISQFSGPAVDIWDSEIRSNTGQAGGIGGLEILNNTSPVTILRSEIRSNRALLGSATYTAGGAGSFENNRRVALIDSSVAENSSEFHMGAFVMSASFLPFNPATGLPVSSLPPTDNEFIIERSAVFNNSTGTGSGYATIYAPTPGRYRVLNSTIAGNTVLGGSGGGIVFEAFNPSAQTDATQVTIRNSTLSRNTSGFAEALSLGAFNPANPASTNAFNGSLTIESSIIGGRQGLANPTSIVDSVPAVTVHAQQNIFESGFSALASVCGSNGNRCALDARLAALAMNGGPTPTLALLPDSPALDTGSNFLGSTRDQRSAARIQGSAIDVGAYEALPVAIDCSLDIDGGGASALVEGLILVRSMLGMNDAAAVAGTGISAAAWTSRKNHLNSRCGMTGTFAP